MERILMIAYLGTKSGKMAKSQTVEAVYENGILRPLQALVNLEEYSKVRIIVEYEENPSRPLLQFAGILSDEEAAEWQSMIAQEFEQIEPNGW